METALVMVYDKGIFVIYYADDLIRLGDSCNWLISIKRTTPSQIYGPGLGPPTVIAGYWIRLELSRLCTYEADKHHTKLLSKIGILNAKPVEIRVDPVSTHDVAVKSEPLTPENHYNFPAITGSLLCLTLNGRPDLCVVSSMLESNVFQPLALHMFAAGNTIPKDFRALYPQTFFHGNKSIDCIRWRQLGRWYSTGTEEPHGLHDLIPQLFCICHQLYPAEYPVRFNWIQIFDLCGFHTNNQMVTHNPCWAESQTAQYKCQSRRCRHRSRGIWKPIKVLRRSQVYRCEALFPQTFDWRWLQIHCSISPSIDASSCPNETS